ncbi:MAG: UDP-N-acetylmuramoylalanyl-D-glutamyl-2,6-diaminopimelate--D-alanyl-D-alanine ligase [Pseudomonadota bacterium]
MNATAPKKTVLWTADEAARASDGMAAGEWSVTGVSIDSRTVEPSDLFVALQGPSFDGHDFVAAALARGAAAAMVHRVPDGVAADAPLLIVDDTMVGLETLGSFARLRSKAVVLAVTGSVGKTGTKEALAACLGAQAKVYATKGNLNNHWGVPLSLARLPLDAEYGVFELGMNHAGEISPLSHQVKPAVSIITTVAAAHLAAFSSVEEIADAKAEIFDGMDSRGVAILNGDNPQLARLVAHARTQGIGRIWTFGSDEQADARLVDCSLHPTASAVNAVIRGEPIQYSLSSPGGHWVMNSLAVLLAVKAAGADVVTAARSLSKITPGAGRGARQKLAISTESGPATILLIDESYNASPAAVVAALDVLGRSEISSGSTLSNRRIAVLGDMLELGPDADRLHRDLIGPIEQADIDLVFACGPHMKGLYEALPSARRGAHAPDSQALAPLVTEALQPGDILMVKGSLGSRMAKVVDAIRSLGADDHAEKFAPHKAANGG